LNPDFKQAQLLPLLPDHPTTTGRTSWLMDYPDRSKFPAGKKPQSVPEANRAVTPLPAATRPFPVRVWKLF